MNFTQTILWLLLSFVSGITWLIVAIGETIAFLGGLLGLAIIVYSLKDQIEPVREGISQGQIFGLQDILMLGINWELILLSTIAIGVGVRAVKR